MYKNSFLVLWLKVCLSISLPSLLTVSIVSGYGKTHLARVYTRHNKAIYLKFSDRPQTSPYYTPIEKQINALCQQMIPDLAEATPDQYKDLTYKAQQVMKVFFLVAINHYAEGFEAGIRNNHLQPIYLTVLQLKSLSFLKLIACPSQPSFLKTVAENTLLRK